MLISQCKQHSGAELKVFSVIIRGMARGLLVSKQCNSNIVLVLHGLGMHIRFLFLKLKDGVR